MHPEDRATGRRQLDKRLSVLINADALAPPSRGWIKAIREALGMTTSQLAKRLSVSQPRVVAIEKAEANVSITLGSLERAAQALDCRLVYALAPRKPLEALVEERARDLATKRLGLASHTMALEAQGVDLSDENEQLKHLVSQLIAKGGSKLWEEDA
ncbi:MAG: mobile mystery protein A [Acidiferrobacteraceae bacterium]